MPIFEKSKKNNPIAAYHKSTTTRKAGGLNLSAALWRTKAKALQCFRR
jgi:hypothetical protein